MGQFLQLQGSIPVSVSLCDCTGGTPGAGRPHQHSVTVEPCSRGQAVSQDAECTSCAPSPREVWGWSPHHKLQLLELRLVCAQGSILVTTRYRVMLESYIWHSLQWAGALGAEGLAPTLWALKTPASGTFSWVTYFRVEISWWEGHLCWLCRSSLLGNLSKGGQKVRVL